MDYYLHTLDPFLVQFSDNFGIRWYGLSYIVGFYLAYLVVLFLAKRNLCLVPVEKAGDFIFNAAIGCMIGGRLGYVLFYSPHLFFDFRSELPYWDALAVNEGGMASHGGMIGIIVACYLFGKRNNIPALHLFDLCAITGPVGIFFGRIANFINGELVGRPAPESAWFKVKFPQDILSWPDYHPEKLSLLSSVVEKVAISPDKWSTLLEQSAYRLDARVTVRSILNKIILEVQSGNTSLQNLLAPLLESRYPSQLYASMLEGGLIFLILILLWKKTRPAGFITGIFFITYAIGRIIGEFFRMPDLQIGFQIFDLTRGQLLSFGLLVLGAFMLYLSSRNKQQS